MPENQSNTGILTEKQREKLQGDVSNAAVRMSHKRARNRLYNTISKDSTHLFEAVADGTLDPDVILQQGVDDYNIGTDSLANGLVDTVALVYLLAEAAKLKPEKIIEDGVDKADRRIRNSRIEALYEIYNESPGELTLNDMQLLIDEGKIDKQKRNEALDRITGP